MEPVMKATASLEKSVAVIIHCELRLETQGATASTEKPETTRISLGAAPNVEQDTNAPSFASFAETWFSENEVRWKHSYKLTLRSSLNKHILPNFGQQRIDQISRAEVLASRSHLAKLPGRNKPSLLSPARFNTIMVPLRLILNEAAIRFDFESPYAGITALRIPRSDVNPFTLEEVYLMLNKVKSDYKPYFTIRFFTGIRTGELHGLKWKYVDFERKEIQIRESFVAGKFTDTKTDASCRDISMSDIVYEALQAQKRRTRKSNLVFCTREGNPLGVQNVSNRVWKPLLSSLNLPYRRLYQTRHTAASLWLASGEHVLWVSQQLGHSDPNTTLRKYAKYAPNLTRKDGSAFAALLANR
jgi:integrase